MSIESKLGITKGKGSQDLPYVTNNKELLGVTVYSAYRADSTKNAKTIHFKKNMSTYDKDEVNAFITSVAKYLYIHTIRRKVDTILVPASSSPLVSEVAKKIADFDKTINIVQDSFKKSSYDEIEPDPAVHGFTPQIEKIILTAIENGRKSGHFELKTIPPQFRKYVKGFMKMQRSVDTKFITGKNVMILDDILTKGTTIVQCAKNINNLAPLSVVAATVFKFQ